MEWLEMVLSTIKKRYGSIPFALSYIVIVVAVAHLSGLALPGKWFLPALNASLFFLLFLVPVSRGEYSYAVKLALFWAVVTTIVQILLSAGWPGLMEEKVLRGTVYREEMLHWVRTGEGPEGDISLFLPIHLRHFLIFCAASLATGGLMGLAMGAVMLGYMNSYVGCLIAVSGGSWITIVFSWPLWSMVRVVGYIVAGTALGAVLLHRQGERDEKKRKILRFMIIAVALVVLDIILKWLLAGTYQGMLNSALAG